MAKNIVLRSKLEGAGKTKRGLKGVDSGLRNLGRSALNAGAAYFGARGLISGFKAAIEAAAQQELAEKKLSTALGKTSKTLLDYASELQKATTFGDEATIEAMSMMAAFTKDEEALKKLTAVTLDYAAATGTDLNAASQLVGRTFGTSMNAMSRYGVAVEGAAGSTERLESLTENLAKMFGGQAAAQAQTMSGQIQQMKNVLGDTAELIGTALGPSLVKFAKQTKQVAEFWIDFLGAGKDADDIFKKFSDDTTVKMNKQIKQLSESIAFGTERVKDLNTGTKNKILLEKRAELQSRSLMEQFQFELDITRDLIAQRDKLKKKLDDYIISKKIEQMQQELGKDTMIDVRSTIDETIMTWGNLNEAVERTGELSDEIIVPLGVKLHVLALMSQQAFGMIASNLATISQAPGWEKMEKVAKRAAQVQALVDAYASANAAFKAMAGIPVVGPTLGYIAAATALAAGLANVKMIESAATGFDGIVNKPTMFMTGEAGAERVSVTPLEGPNINGPQGGNIHLHFGAVTNEDYVKDFIVPEIEKAQRLNLA